MKNSYLLIFLFLIIVAGIGYFVVSGANKTESVVNEPEDPFLSSLNEGFGVGYFKDRSNTAPLNQTMYVDDGEFTGYFEVLNGFHKANDFLVMAFVDYNNTAFFYNNTLLKNHVVNTVAPKTSLSYPFKFTNLTEGFHDIIFVTFFDPYNKSTADDFRIRSDQYGMEARFNVINGHPARPEVQLENIARSNSSPEVFGNILLTQKQYPLAIWLNENVTKGSIINYYINVGNTDENRTFVVMPLLDYEQIPINYNSTDNTCYYSLGKGEAGIINASLKVPDDTGIHELTVLVVKDPYNDLEVSPGVAKDDMRWSVVYSRRICLNVTG